MSTSTNNSRAVVVACSQGCVIGLLKNSDDYTLIIKLFYYYINDVEKLL